jgi:transmembrane sensor
MNNNSHTEVDYNLLGRYFSGEASPAEAIELEEWLSASPENKQLFEKISQLSGNLSSEEPCIVPDRSAFFQQIKDQFPQLHQPKVYSFKIIPVWIKIAASFLIVASAALLFTLRLKKDQHDNTMAVTRQTQQAILHDTLPDGSTVTLNSYSQLQYPDQFIDHSRELQLNGEAWFEVTANPLKPFVITTGPLRIKVIGTSFNVRNGKETIEVSVKTGVVRMYNNLDSITIASGKKGIYNLYSHRFNVIESFHSNEVAYATKIFNFENATLKEIIGQLQKAYGITIVINNKNLETCTMSSSFENKPIEYIFDVLAMTLNIQYRIEHKTVYISGNSCT